MTTKNIKKCIRKALCPRLSNRFESIWYCINYYLLNSSFKLSYMNEYYYLIKLNVYIKMRQISSFFESELDKYLDVEKYIDARNSPDKLIQKLKDKSYLKKFVKVISSPNTNPH